MFSYFSIDWKLIMKARQIVFRLFGVRSQVYCSQRRLMPL